MQIDRLGPVASGVPGDLAAGRKGRQSEEASFQTILDGLAGPQGLQFSRHARERMQERNITLGKAEMARLSQGVARAASKGSRDSLLLLDNLALVVSVKSRTVVTAVDGPHLKENVFTNIDSAVIV